MTAEDQRQYGATPGERRAYEMFQLKRTVRLMLRAQNRLKYATWHAEDHPDEAAGWFWREGWRRAYHMYRKQVEDLIA